MTKFSELSRYGPHLMSNPTRKAQMFERRLKPVIRHCLSTLNLKTYEEVFKRAQGMEADIEESQKYRDNLNRDNRDDRGKGKQVYIDQRSFLLFPSSSFPLLSRFPLPFLVILSWMEQKT